MIAPFDKIFFISLSQTLGRRSAMIQYIKEIDLKDRHGNSPECFLGSNGNSYPQHIDCKGRKTMVSRSEIGCYASHYLLWQKIAESEYESVLILEDDARFKPICLNLFFEWNTWNTLPEWDYINFCCNSYSGLPIEKNLVDEKLKLYSGYGYWLTHAYCIKKETAKILIELMKVQRGGLDWQLSQVQKEFKSFAFDGSPIFQKRIGPASTTIKHTRI